jgi:anaerobic magnesium-protoporphyrin IX monomethyl ester cyclase
MAPCRVLVWFKFTEMVLQCRPKAVFRVLFNRDAGLRHAMRWYTEMGRRVWPHEILEFLRDRRLRWGPTVREFWGAPQDEEEQSMSAAKPERRVGVREAA